MNTTVLLADDHALTRTGVKQTVESEMGYTIIAEAENGREAVDMARTHHPDIVILDISMPELNGIDAAHQILEEYPRTKIIILSMHSDKHYVQRALHAGVSGYLLKECAIDEVVLALKHVSRGNFFISPEITGVVIDGFRYPDSNDTIFASHRQLTPREREVLQMVAEGKTTKEIADVTYVSVKTVEARRRQIMEKLDLHSIAELTKYAIKEGITSLD